MMTEKCCICDEPVKSAYSYMHHTDNGEIRVYSGHKRCLFLVPDRLKTDVELNYDAVRLESTK